MAPAKNCRHVSQALRLPDFRRALKAHDFLACQLCAVPPAKQNSRVRTGSGSSKKSGSPNALLPSPSPQLPVVDDAPLQGWERSAAWEDLCICITCGFIGCLSGNHFSQHFQINPKHFVGFYAGAKTFWCCPCKQEIMDGKAKVEDARRECQESFDDIVAKQQRKIKNRVVLKTPSGQEEDQEQDAGDTESSENSDGAKNSSVGQAKQATGSETAENSEQVMAPRKEKRSKEKRESRKAKNPEPADASAQSAPAAGPPVSSVLGFTNLGNTCYFNSALQALLTIAHYFPEHVYLDDALEAPNSPILATFSMLHETIKKKTRRRPASSISTIDLKQKGKKRDAAAKPDAVLTVAPLLKELRKKFVQFRGNYQQDAHELFMSLLWAIDEEADPPVAPAADTPASGEPTENVSKADKLSAAKDKEAPAESGDEDSDEKRQIFVKTETGETISLQVPVYATVKDVQRLLARRLNLDEDDMILDHQGTPSSSSSSSQPSVSRHSSRLSAAMRAQKSFSKLNFARHLFGGELTTLVTCQACGNQSETLEDAFQLSVSVPSTATPRSLSTIDCLKDFMSETQLLVSAKNGYECEKCSRVKSPEPEADEKAVVVLRDATMRLVVSQLPQVLVIHIKRLGRLKKITQHIQFDGYMDMTPYIGSKNSNKLRTKQSTFYELVAVVVHMGNKRSGHYIAYVSRSRKRDAQPLDSTDNKEADPSLCHDSDDDFDPRAEILTSENPSRSWYYISDTVVKRVTFEQVLRCEAYMLFYRQLPPDSRSLSCAPKRSALSSQPIPRWSMSASADGDHAPPTDADGQQLALLVNGAGADTRVAENERLAAAAELVAATARQVTLDRKCSTLGDAEEVCVQLVVEIVEDMFMEMQVLDENERCFTAVARFTIDQLFGGVQMGGVQANESLDRVVTVDAKTRVSGDATIQQILKPGDDGDSDEREEATVIRRPKKPKVCRNHPQAAPLEFLRLLLSSLEKQQSAVTTAFLEFPSTSYTTAAAPHPARGGHQYHNNKPNGAVGGIWTIPASALSGLLQHFIAVSNLSVLPSVVQFVVEVNRGALEMKKKQKTLPRLTLAQVQLCVQKAVFAAEETVQELEKQEQQRMKALQAALSAKADSLKLIRVFQTEVLKTIGNAASKEVQHNGENLDDDLPLVCYLDENDPVSPPIDRNAPSSLAKKPAASSKQGIARKVLLAMKPGPGKNSKWLSLRTKLLVTGCNTTELTIEVDMNMSALGSFFGDKTAQQAQSVGSLGSQQPAHPQPSKKKSFAAAAPGAGKSQAADKKPLPSFSIEPDAAALSNIFSLGTPRQMNTDELARRNDILALLEREEMKNERRMANASIAAMSMPVATSLSETDKTYQAYVAANSVIIAPLSQAQTVSLQSGDSGSMQQPAATLSPKRPEKKSANQHREPAMRTKFDLEREPPAFIVSDGNAHVRDELNALEKAMCSPIKRSKGRGIREQQHPQPPPPAAAGAMSNSSHADASSPIKVSEHHDPHRPIQTASSHLPQLETSRLAVGVRAVVRGVEKRGPKRSPSRKSRLKLHNYNTQDEVTVTDAEEQELHDSPPSPISRQQQPAAPGSFLPLIPPVSPIKASPHRKNHVKFHGNGTAGNNEPPVALAKENASSSSPGCRPSPAKQPVWDKKISSPPRVRNRHFASGSTSKAQKFHPFLFQNGAAGDGVEAEENDVDEDAENLFKVGYLSFPHGGSLSADELLPSVLHLQSRIEAPRRSYLPVHDQG